MFYESVVDSMHVMPHAGYSVSEATKVAIEKPGIGSGGSRAKAGTKHGISKEGTRNK